MTDSHRRASPRRLYRRACRLAEAGRTDEAVSVYRQVATAEKGDRTLAALARNDLAVLTLLAGDRAAARTAFAEALTLDPQCGPAKANLALLDADALEPGAPAKPEPVAQPPSAVIGVAQPPPAVIGSHVAQPPPAVTKTAKRVKVAILSTLFNWPSTGGGTVHTAELADFLQRDGFEVGHIYARNEAAGVGRVVGRLPYPAQSIDFPAAWTADHVRTAFRQAVDAFDPDHVIITDSWNTKPLLADALGDRPYILRFQALECFCPLNNVRLLPPGPDGRFRQCGRHQFASPRECRDCVSTFGKHSGSLHRDERRLSGFGTQEYSDMLMRTVRRAAAVLVVNPLMQAMLAPWNDNVQVVTAGMDPARFSEPRPPRPRTDGRPLSIVFAGLVREQIKGFDVLHRACSILHGKRRDFELLATDDPPGRIDEFTRLIGWRSQADLPAVLADADIVAVPAVAQEALGRTAVEAMAAGRPVAASRIGGLQFTVPDGAAGLLFEPGDADDLAEKLGRLLDDPELRVRLGAAGRRRFLEHYSWDVIIRRHSRPLLAAVASGGRA